MTVATSSLLRFPRAKLVIPPCPVDLPLAKLVVLDSFG